MAKKVEPVSAEIDWEAAERAALQAESEEPENDNAIPVEEPDFEEPEESEAPAPKPAPEPPAAPPKVNLAPSHRQRLASFGEMLEKAMPKMRAVIPKHVNAERLFHVAYQAMVRNPALLQCTEVSVLRAVIIGAQLGLDISGIGGMAYLVPYRNKRTSQMEAQFIVGYKGMIDLARRSQEVAWIFTAPVYLAEKFDYVVDPIPRVFHKPILKGDPGEFVGAYAIAVFRDKTIPPQPKVMGKEAIDRIKNKSRAKDNGPWVTDYEAMAMKTTIRALCGLLPQSPELAMALDIEDQIEAGETITLPGEVELEEETPAAPPADGGVASVKAKLGKKK